MLDIIPQAVHIRDLNLQLILLPNLFLRPLLQRLLTQQSLLDKDPAFFPGGLEVGYQIEYLIHVSVVLGLFQLQNFSEIELHELEVEGVSHF